MSVFNVTLTNRERATFILGVVVGAAGALSGSLLDRHLESRPGDIASSQISYVQSPSDIRERQCYSLLARTENTPYPRDCYQFLPRLGIHSEANASQSRTPSGQAED